MVEVAEVLEGTLIVQKSLKLQSFLYLLVLACSCRPKPQAGACRVLQKGGRRVSVRLGVRLLFGLGGLLTYSCSFLLLQ